MRKESKIGKNVIEKKFTIQDVRLVNIKALHIDGPNHRIIIYRATHEIKL